MNDFAYKSMGPTLQTLPLVILLAMADACIALGICLATLPGRIAIRRGNPQASAINICGWLGLPTGILWVVAMVWAVLRRSLGPFAIMATACTSTSNLATHLDKLEEAEGDVPCGGDDRVATLISRVDSLKQRIRRLAK